MPLHDLTQEESEFIKGLINKVIPHNVDRNAMQAFLAQGNSVLQKLAHPIQFAGKPKIITSPSEFTEKVE